MHIFKIKRFNEFSINELYSVMQLRSNVFVVEQNCVYLDLDGKDEKALHVVGYENDKIVAYARLFNQGDYFEEASIGRVVVDPVGRGKGFGHELMKAAIEAVQTHYQTAKITISAQEYLQKFYEEHGFQKVSEMYLEDDIPHIRMERN